MAFDYKYMYIFSIQLFGKIAMVNERNGGQGINWQQITNYYVVTEQGLRPENTKDVISERYLKATSSVD